MDLFAELDAILDRMDQLDGTNATLAEATKLHGRAKTLVSQIPDDSSPAAQRALGRVSDVFAGLAARLALADIPETPA